MLSYFFACPCRYISFFQHEHFKVELRSQWQLFWSTHCATQQPLELAASSAALDDGIDRMLELCTVDTVLRISGDIGWLFFPPFFFSPSWGGEVQTAQGISGPWDWGFRMLQEDYVACHSMQQMYGEIHMILIA